MRVRRMCVHFFIIVFAIQMRALLPIQLITRKAPRVANTWAHDYVIRENWSKKLRHSKSNRVERVLSRVSHHDEYLNIKRVNDTVLAWRFNLGKNWPIIQMGFRVCTFFHFYLIFFLSFFLFFLPLKKHSSIWFKVQCVVICTNVYVLRILYEANMQN